jgi:hypothetical protein
VTFLWAWSSSAPAAAASGVSGDMGRARRAAAQWMRANGADASLLEEVRLAIGARSLLPHHEPTGVVMPADMCRDGRVRWRPAA